jgi:SAM-dependent methyltransferase
VRKVLPIYDAWFGKHLPANTEVPILDVGCGYGNFLYWVTARGFTNLEGIDVSSEQVALARHICPSARIFCEDWQTFLRTKQKRYDFIACLDVVEHMTRDELFAFLDGAHNALQPGGTLLLQTINGEGLTSAGYIYGDLTHETILSPGSLSTALRLSGFVDLSVRPTSPVPKNVKGIVRLLLWRAIAGVVTFVNLVETGSRGSGIVTRNMIAVAKRPVETRGNEVRGDAS